MSDNGASQEGGPFGVLHEMKYFNMVMESPEEAVQHLDDIGGPSSHSNYPWVGPKRGTRPSSGTSRTRTKAACTYRSSSTGRRASPRAAK